MRLNNTSVIGLLIFLLISETGYTGICHDNVKETTPDSRFEILGSIVRDLQTGLIWQRCAVGQRWNGSDCRESASTHTWSDALSLATGDWRLPNIKELASIVEMACSIPALNLKVFPSAPNRDYWSSTPYAGNSSSAWSFFFFYGEDRVRDKDDTYNSFVRLVRDAR